MMDDDADDFLAIHINNNPLTKKGERKNRTKIEITESNHCCHQIRFI